jgi:hypothetical protein
MKSPKELMARYPYQFAGEQISMSFSRGWFSLFAQLCADIDQALGDDKRGFHWVQVKEKFGQARVYFQLGAGVAEREPDLAEKLMALKVKAEVDSSKVCALCGRPGTIDLKPGWMLALCESHRVQADAGTLPSIWFSEDEL